MRSIKINIMMVIVFLFFSVAEGSLNFEKIKWNVDSKKVENSFQSEISFLKNNLLIFKIILFQDVKEGLEVVFLDNNLNPVFYSNEIRKQIVYYDVEQVKLISLRNIFFKIDLKITKDREFNFNFNFLEEKPEIGFNFECKELLSIIQEKGNSISDEDAYTVIKTSDQREIKIKNNNDCIDSIVLNNPPENKMIMINMTSFQNNDSKKIPENIKTIYSEATEQKNVPPERLTLKLPYLLGYLASKADLNKK